MCKILILPDENCFSNFNKTYTSMIDKLQIKEYLFPNLNAEIITNDKYKEDADIFIISENSYISSNKTTTTKLNILISVENLSNKKFKWYKHYNLFGDYDDKRIKLYMYNHIDRILKTEYFLALPLIYFRMNYYKLKQKYYFNHPQLQTPFSQKKFCLIINKSKLNKNINILAKLLTTIGQLDDIKMYNHLIENKSCYNSIELLKVFNQYKFIICFENSYVNSGYITEKIFNVFFSNSIPLYSGSCNIHNYFNKDGFINVLNLKQCIDRVKELNNNEYLYMKYINAEKISNSYKDENFLEVMKTYVDSIIKEKI